MDYQKIIKQKDGSYTKLGVRPTPEILQYIPKSIGSWLDLTAGNGSFALSLSNENISVTALEMSKSAQIALKATSAGKFDVLICLPWEIKQQFDFIALVLPADRGNELVKAMIESAFRALKVGGKAYFAGHKNLGFERYLKNAVSLFGQGEIIERDSGFRLAELIKISNKHIFPPSLSSFTINARGKTLDFSCWPGVFSAGRLDNASKLLLENLPNVANKDVLDLGCGYGALSLFLATENTNITMLDDDLLSVRSAEISSIQNDLNSKVKILHSDVDSALDNERFDLAIMNPPFHIGKKVSFDVAFEFIECAKQRAKEIWIVANASLPYEKILNRPKEIIKTSGFKILYAKNSS